MPDKINLEPLKEIMNWVVMQKDAIAESTNLDYESLNNMAKAKKQGEQIARDVAKYGGLSKTNIIKEFGLGDDLLEGIGMGSAGGKIPKKTVKGIGKVLNNTISPFSYDSKIKEFFEALKSPKKLFRAIIKEEPLYSNQSGYSFPDFIPGNELMLARELPYKAMFGREASTSKAGRDIYTKVGKKKYKFNQKNPIGKKMHGYAKQNIEDSLFDFTPLNEIPTGYKGVADLHPTMGGFNFKAGKKVIGYKDRWDVKVNENDATNSSAINRYGFLTNREKISSTIQRMFLDILTDPMTIVGKIPK